MEKTKKKINIKASDIKAVMSPEIQYTIIPVFILRSVEIFFEKREIEYLAFHPARLPEGTKYECKFAGRTMHNSIICIESHVSNLIEIAEQLWHIPQDEICWYAVLSKKKKIEYWEKEKGLSH